MTHSSTYRDAWENTVGAKGGMFVAIVNTLDPLLGIYANASILGQSLMLLLQGIHIDCSQVECLLLITVLAIVPLCLMKNLNALAPFSAMGMAAVIAVLGAMLIRYWDGTYQPGGIYWQDLPNHLQPKFGETNNFMSIQVLPFVCMVYTSFDMHYNSPQVCMHEQTMNCMHFGNVTLLYVCAFYFLTLLCKQLYCTVLFFTTL